MSQAIRCTNITKRFGSVVANDKVNFEVKFGEVMALLGENGSGKTTLMNMLSGIYHPDEGSIEICGKHVTISSPNDSIELGIGMIHQHFKLVEVMTAFENILLGIKPKKGATLKQLKQDAIDLCKQYELDIELDKKIYDMSVSEKQTVEVLKVLYRGAKILILDEPTAVLTPQEIKSLFNILRTMKKENCAVVIITHKLNEVMEISDRVAILRKGQCIETVITKDVNEKILTELMVGRPINLAITRPEINQEHLKSIMQIKNLTVNKSDGTKGLDNISFDVNAGEILGIAGIAGSGQKELTESILGLIPVQQGEIIYEGTNLAGKDTSEIYQMGVSLAFVPEDRLGMGLVASMGMVENMMLKTYNDNSGFFVDKAPSEQLAKDLKDKLEIKTPSIDTPVRLLSGGNVQKVLLGREIEASPKVLITAYPVRGLDINSSYTIYDLLNEQKEKGCAVIFVGEDLDVLLQLADRILVLCHGEITGIVDASQVSKEQVGLLMAGHIEEAV